MAASARTGSTITTAAASPALRVSSWQVGEKTGGIGTGRFETGVEGWRYGGRQTKEQKKEDSYSYGAVEAG
jgi:hypothetical protein